MRFFGVFLAGILIALFLSGCGRETKDPITETTVKSPVSQKAFPPTALAVTLDGFMGAENIGMLMAEKRGYFVDEGLEVRLGVPRRPRRPMRYVEERQDDLGVLQPPQLAIARGKGVPVVALGSVISHPTAAMISLNKSGIDSIGDLKGRTIGITGIPFQELFLENVLERADLTLDDVNLRTLDYDLVPALLSGRADAIFGGAQNLEVIELEKQGATPVVTPFEDLGIPQYEDLVIVARENLLAEEPEAVRRFMAAVERGTAAAIENPRSAMRAIIDAPESNPEISREAVEAQVEATIPLLSMNGSIDSNQLEELTKWMQTQGMIPEAVPAAALLSDQD
jgi:putative hydroxymethylpyrimidine transport system substrate-binding protein